MELYGVVEGDTSLNTLDNYIFKEQPEECTDGLGNLVNEAMEGSIIFNAPLLAVTEAVSAQPGYSFLSDHSLFESNISKNK